MNKEGTYVRVLNVFRYRVRLDSKQKQQKIQNPKSIPFEISFVDEYAKKMISDPRTIR